LFLANAPQGKIFWGLESLTCLVPCALQGCALQALRLARLVAKILQGLHRASPKPT